MIFFLPIHLFLFLICDSKLIGTVNKARFTSVDRLNSNTLWIYNQISPKQCLCTVLSQHNNVLLFNSYSNGSCQLFLSLPYKYTMEYNTNSTLILLSSLPPVNQAPCCSNLTWLMLRIQISALSTVSLTKPNYLVIDDRDYLAVLANAATLNLYNRAAMALVSSTSISLAESLSYYNKQYFIIMVVAIQIIQTIVFYNVISSTFFTLTSTLSASAQPNTLYHINDTLLYVFPQIIGYEELCHQQRLLFSRIIFNQQWMHVIDYWVSTENYSIRIFDTYRTNSLYNWTLGDDLIGIVLRKNFDLYVADDDDNEILSCRPNIEQCTS